MTESHGSLTAGCARPGSNPVLAATTAGVVSDDLGLGVGEAGSSTP